MVLIFFFKPAFNKLLIMESRKCDLRWLKAGSKAQKKRMHRPFAASAPAVSEHSTDLISGLPCTDS